MSTLATAQAALAALLARRNIGNSASNPTKRKHRAKSKKTAVYKPRTELDQELELETEEARKRRQEKEEINVRQSLNILKRVEKVEEGREVRKRILEMRGSREGRGKKRRRREKETEEEESD